MKTRSAAFAFALVFLGRKRIKSTAAYSHNEMKKIMLGMAITVIILLLVGFVFFSVKPDFSKAEIVLKHTIKLPAGFSIESTVPLDLSKVKEQAAEVQAKLFDGDLFSVPFEIKDRKGHSNTRLKLVYDKNLFDSIQAYSEDGAPLKLISDGIFELEKAASSNPKPVYIAGKSRKLSSQKAELRPIKIQYLDELENVLAQGEQALTFYPEN